MKSFQRFIWVVCAILAVFDSGFAQEMRIYTTIRDRSPAAAAKQSDQRSLMLFHAGKVYDYIEPAQEVTVFEPAHRRFTVLNVRRQLRSELTQDEIRQFLSLAEEEAHRKLAEATVEGNPALRKSLDLLHFQLQPEFVTTFDSMKSQLTLNSPYLRYTVEGFAPPSLDIVEKYLHVADWMAQFNSVLHPQSMLPAPRMKLNQELRQRGLIPSHVDLQAGSDANIHLQAQHEWTWNLQKTDRQMIDEWEKQLQNPKLRTLTFHQFQQEMLKRQ